MRRSVTSIVATLIALLAIFGIVYFLQPPTDGRILNMNEEELILVPIPSLGALLLNKERAKGSPLTEEEVIQIRENAVCVALPPDAARKMEESRGYRDISLVDTWSEFQALRNDLSKEENPTDQSS